MARESRLYPHLNYANVLNPRRITPNSSSESRAVTIQPDCQAVLVAGLVERSENSFGSQGFESPRLQVLESK